MRRLVLVLLPLLAACGSDKQPPGADTLLSEAAGWLWSKQAEDGGWHSETYGLLRSGQSLTPFVLDALLDVPQSVHKPSSGSMDRAVAFITSRVDEAGALGRKDPEIEDYPNYATALGIRVLQRVGGHEELVRRMENCLLRQQFTGQNGWSKDHPAYGAWGMGGEIRRPPQPGHIDISMTRYVMEALAERRRRDKETVSAFMAAFTFLDRLLNRPEDDDSPGWGYVFSTVLTEKNKAGPSARGGFRPYGTSTADGILMLAAGGLPATDEAVQSALQWLLANHRGDRVPGFREDERDRWALSMIHYYRAASSRALRFAGAGEAPAGRDWRKDLVAALAKEQLVDGGFANRGTLMKEDDPFIATALAIKALAAARR